MDERERWNDLTLDQVGDSGFKFGILDCKGRIAGSEGALMLMRMSLGSVVNNPLYFLEHDSFKLNKRELTLGVKV